MSKEFPDIAFVNVDGQAVPFTKPQHYKKGSSTETLLTGEDNPLPTKDESVEARLQAIEQTQSQILNKLNDTIDTRLTGSNVEVGIPVYHKGSLVDLGRVLNYEITAGSTKYALIRTDIYTKRYFVGVRESNSSGHDFDLLVAFYDKASNTSLYGYTILQRAENSHTLVTNHEDIKGNEVGFGIRNKSDSDKFYNVFIWGCE